MKMRVLVKLNLRKLKMAKSKGSVITNWIVIAFFLASVILYSEVSIAKNMRESDEVKGSLSQLSAQRVADQILLLQNLDYGTAKLNFGAEYMFHILEKKGVGYSIKVSYKDIRRWSGESNLFKSEEEILYGEKWKVKTIGSTVFNFIEAKELCIVKLGDKIYLMNAKKEGKIGKFKISECDINGI